MAVFVASGSPIDLGAPIDSGAPVVALAALDRDGNVAYSLLALATVHPRATTLPLPSIFSHEFF